MKLHEKQKEIVKDKHRFKVICAGRRFGKTIFSIEKMLFDALHKDNAKIAYIAPTYQQARDIAWEQLKTRVEPIKGQINESRLEIEVPNIYKGKSKIVLRSWDNIETLRGQAFHLIILDEVASMKSFEAGWKEVLRPSLTDFKGSAIFISTPKGFNHFYEMAQMEGKDDDYKTFHFTSYDNPFLDKEELDKAREELNEDQFAQEYLAEWRKMEGLVYKEFNRAMHLYDPEFKQPQGRQELLGGIDFGFTNPCAILQVAVDFDGRYWVIDEYYKTGKTDAEIAEYASTIGFNIVYPDPENPAGIEELKRKGLNCREVNKGNDSIVKGVDLIRDLFKQGRILINKNCSNLIWELETYHYPEDKQERNKSELPVKKDDHLLDALRYIMLMHKPYQVNRFTQANINNSFKKSNIGL